MTREQAINIITEHRDHWLRLIKEKVCRRLDGEDTVSAFNVAIAALSAEPSEDAISRQAAIEKIHWLGLDHDTAIKCDLAIRALPPVIPDRPTGHCKDCKYFEYDAVVKVDDIPLIMAHEICKRWGDGCKTKEDGYCFLFEPRESEDKG